jgi:hypothetical protein
MISSDDVDSIRLQLYKARILTYYKTKLRWKRTSRFGTV